jgi:molybdopterin-guanine dinucleotide biosynthesis protein A
MEKTHLHYNAILLAGDRGASRAISGINKVFLEMNGIPLFIYVLKALEEATTINRICLIGPTPRLAHTVDHYRHLLENKKEIIIVEQAESLFANALKAFYSLYPELQDAPSVTSPECEKSVLYLPGDIPLVTPFEIDTFITLCTPDTYDYCAGLTSADELVPFYPHRGEPGIKPSYFHIMEGRYRQNNLHLVKPLKVLNMHYIQKVYDYRYQKDLYNIIKLALEFFKIHVGIEGLWCYSLLHWHQFLSRIYLNPLTIPTRKLLPLSFIENSISKVLNTRFATVISPSIGTTLDIDNARDYKTMSKMFSHWQRSITHLEERWKENYNSHELRSRHHAA